MAFPSTAQMRAIGACYRSNTPVLLWGSPGVGKTAKISAMLARWTEFFDVIVGGNREAADFLGLPVATADGGVVNVPPMYGVKANAAKTAALFFDELTTAAPSVQKAMLRVFQERVLGELQLGDHVRLIAAANPVEEAADGWDLSAPTANRLCHIDWKFDVDEWLMGVGNGFETTPTYTLDELIGKANPTNRALAYSQVTGFLRERGSEHLNPPVPKDPAKAGKAWPSPRSWSNVIDVMAELNPRDDDAILLVVKGLVGEAAAKEFFAWRELASLPNPDEVLADPANAVDWSQRPDVLFAVARSVTYIVVSRGTEDMYAKAFRVMAEFEARSKSDIALPSLKELILSMPSKVALPSDVQAKYAHLFEQAGILAAA